MTRFSAAIVLQIASSFNHQITLHTDSWYQTFRRYFSASLKSYNRANNISITVAETEADLFYNASTGEQNNLFGYIESKTDASADIRCDSVTASRIVQEQINILAGQDFHLT